MGRSKNITPEFDSKKIKTQEKTQYVPISVLRNICKRFEKEPDNYKLAFEYIITACFPTIYKNIMSYAKDCYTQGYLEGMKVGKDENKGNN